MIFIYNHEILILVLERLNHAIPIGRVVVSGQRTAIFIDKELMHKPFPIDTTANRPVYTNMRVKMGASTLNRKSLLKTQVNLPAGTKIENVRYV